MTSISRRLVIVGLIGVICACLGGLGAGSQATRDAVLRTMASRSLAELALLSGVSDDSGELQRVAAMEVEVVSDGGAMWALTGVEEAVEASPHFALGNSPHVIRSEFIDERGGVALQLHLWRSGWELREPEPRRARVAPWAAVVGGVVGAIIALFTSRISFGLASAGVIAQIGLALDPLPEHLFPPQGLAAAWASGPLVARCIDWVRNMDLLGLGVVSALLTASVVLVAFDHRRSRGDESDLGLGVASFTAIFGTIGGLCWLEAASRGALFAACDLRFGAYLGLVALLGLILAWLPAIGVARESWRS